MKRRIEQLLNGIFEYEAGHVEIRPEELELAGKPGDVLHGRFFVEGADGQRLHGFLYPSDVRMICDPIEFHGISNEIHYQYDCSGLKASEAAADGKIVVCCDCGEFAIPYSVCIGGKEASVELPFSDLTGFAQLARTNYQKAYRYFLTPEFRGMLKDRPELLALCEGLSYPDISYRSMEEFLTGAGLKEIMTIQVEPQSLNFGELKEPVQETLRLQKNTWGFQTISVESDALFVRPERKLFTTDDFAGSTFDVNLILDTNLMHAGNNYARLTFEAGRQTFCVEVTAKRQPKHAKNQQLHIRKIMMKKLENLYVSFRLQKSDLATWVEHSVSVINSYKRAGGDDPFVDLFLVQLYFADDKKYKASRLLEQIEAQKEKLNTPERYCYYLYITTFLYREASYVDRVEEEVSRQFYRNSASWPLQWILLYLQEKYLNDPAARYEAVAAQFTSGCRSRILYLEAWQALRENPFLMRHLGEFELHLLRFANQEKVMTAEILRQSANLAMHASKFDRRLYEVFTNGWYQYPLDDLVKAICQILIRGEKKDRQYFEWYERGVESGLRMNGLYEAYMQTMDLPETAASQGVNKGGTLDETMAASETQTPAVRKTAAGEGKLSGERPGAEQQADIGLTGDVSYQKRGTDGELAAGDARTDLAEEGKAAKSADAQPRLDESAWLEGAAVAKRPAAEGLPEGLDGDASHTDEHGEDGKAAGRQFQDLPQIIRMYFAYDTSLDYRRRAALYRSIAENRDTDPQTWLNYRASMERFVMEQLESGHITDDLVVLYRQFLRESMITVQLARKLIRLLFTYEITCETPGICQIVVHSERVPGERSVNLRKGRGTIRVYDPDSAIFAVDAKGQRFEAGSLCQIRHMFEEERMLAWCAKKVPDAPGMVVFLCVESQKASLMNERLLPYFCTGSELEPLSDAFRDELRREVLAYYMEHPRDESLPAFLEQISYDDYAQVDKAAIIALLAEESKCAEAFELLNSYGAEDIPLIQLVRICSRMVLELEFEENAMLLSLCHRCFALGKYDDKLLRYLLLYFEGAVEDMERVWSAACEFGLDTMLIEEKILTMMLFTHQGTEGSEPIFEAYVKKMGRKKLCKAYVNLKSYEYFVKGQPVADSIFTFIEKEYRRLSGTGDLQEQEDVCRLALLEHYARAAALTKAQRVYAAELLEEFNSKGMRFAFFRRFDRELQKPLRLQGHVFAEYVGNPKSTVYILYREPDKAEFTKELVPNCFEGIFVREFVLFAGEEIECGFIEIPPSQDTEKEKKEIRSELWTLKADPDEKDIGMYGLLNQLCGAIREGDEAVTRDTLDTWLTYEYLSEEVFTLV